jgi:glutamate--cysteine ligase
MNSTYLSALIKQNKTELLHGGLKGIEKESLRLNNSMGFIAQTEHPYTLGSALSHPHITTDYSEALIELITSPFADIRDTLKQLQDIHYFVYEHLQDEILLSASMPCGIDGDMSIPIARYGSSNIGRMKHIYRHGLWHRYGRTMQAIAGIHFNYSLPEKLLVTLHSLQNEKTIEQFTAESYFNLVRNFQRIGWLILYLFGASPAICKNFFKSRPELMAQFDEFDAGTLYHPYATSLRMSDIGYKSNNQANLAIDYNSLDGYVQSLTAAINTPFPEYEKIGVLVNGEYKQLNSNILQIENEFYSIMRPKQVAQSCEKPTLALKRRGVRYVEMRSLDLNIFEPLGINETTARFIEALLLTCFLSDSPPADLSEQKINNSNQLLTAHEGRKPNLVLNKNGTEIRLVDWANAILDDMQCVCELLDKQESKPVYTNALNLQRAVVNNAGLTPSAQLLSLMREQTKPFAKAAFNLSQQHANVLKQSQLTENTRAHFQQLAEQSHQKQKTVEANDTLNFAEFLTRYFSQQ